MDAGFSHYATERGQPGKCVLQSAEYRRRGRNGSRISLRRANSDEAPSTSALAGRHIGV
jgi:hypothetical protein